MTSTSENVQEEDIIEISPPQIPVIPFAVALPTSTLQSWDDPSPPKGNAVSLMGDNGIVGSIVLLNNSVMVWVGWGTLQLPSSSLLFPGLPTTIPDSNSGFGKGIPTMGQLVVAMPRTNYKGGSSNTTNNDASCSHLIGSANSDDQMLASQMASRLSTRSGKAVLVSCQLSATQNEWTAGLDSEMISHRAAAMAEKEIWRILQTQQQQQKTGQSTSSSS
jgi:hypothetical protein